MSKKQTFDERADSFNCKDPDCPCKTLSSLPHSPNLIRTFEPDAESPRASALDEAKALITGDRNNTYGAPTQDFSRAAGVLNSLGYRANDGREIKPHDIAIMVMAVKMSRLVWTPAKRDSWVDIAGYAGCGYECAVTE